MLLLFIIATLFSSEANKATLNISAVSLYQPFQQIESQKEELAFWQQKVKSAPRQFTFQQQLAQANESMFALTGDIQYLKASEALLRGLSQRKIPGKAGVLRALAKNYISQHRFQDALAALEQALENGHKRKATQLMLIDVYEELGWEEKRKALLDQFAEDRDFNYLIRLAKWEDGQGRLANTIELMHEAEAIALAGNQKARLCWIYSNLGDYYGHAGEIDKARAHYEKALRLNPADWYSTKGLAWIAYAHDHESERALHILKMLSKTVNDPSIVLSMAELQEYKKNYTAADQLKQQVVERVSQADYGNMYRHFLVQQYAENQSTIKKATQLAQQEIQERAVPASYDLLAYTYYKKGDLIKAQAISKQYIIGKTFEPGVLINQVYYFEDANLSFLRNIKEELPSAKFELGPLAYEAYERFIQL